AMDWTLPAALLPDSRPLRRHHRRAGTSWVLRGAESAESSRRDSNRVVAIDRGPGDQYITNAHSVSPVAAITYCRPSNMNVWGALVTFPIFVFQSGLPFVAS